jgi:hypothetical protein
MIPGVFGIHITASREPPRRRSQQVVDPEVPGKYDTYHDQIKHKLRPVLLDHYQRTGVGRQVSGE